MNQQMHSIRWNEIKEFLGCNSAECNLTGKNIHVAVIDSGFSDWSLLLQDRILSHPSNINFTKDADIEDRLGHGTMMSHIMSSPNGLSPEIQFYHLKIDTFLEEDPMHNLYRALLHISRYYKGDKKSKTVKPDIVLLAIADHWLYKQLPENPANYHAINQLVKQLRQENIIVVASSGNQYAHDQGMSFPAILPDCLSVSAIKFHKTDSNNYQINHSTFTNYIIRGPYKTDLFLPGERIPTRTVNGQHSFINGSSSSAALAISIVALLKEHYNTIIHPLYPFTINLIRTIINKTTNLEVREIKSSMIPRFKITDAIRELDKLLNYSDNGNPVKMPQTYRTQLP